MKKSIVDAIDKLSFMKGRYLENEEECLKIVDEVVELLKEECGCDKATIPLLPSVWNVDNQCIDDLVHRPNDIHPECIDDSCKL
jgi:hypothetical protein